MDIAHLGYLAVLALVDSTSFGTLLIPIWLLMAPGRVRFARIGFFLAVVAAAYFTVGIALLLGATWLLDTFDGFTDLPAFPVVVLVVGIVLVIVSWGMDTPRARARAASGSGRFSAWRTRAVGSDGSGGSFAALATLAIVAVLAEIATMVPYLAAIGIITTEGPGGPGNLVLLALYCLVMIAPALVLTVGRIVARGALDSPLASLDRWLTKNASSTVAWVIGIVGVILALNAVGQLGFLG